MIDSLQPHVCKNCGNDFTKNFCNNCGQKETHRITIPHVLHDLVHVFLHADKGIFPFMSRVMVQPGIIAKEYVEGKRKIFNPFQYLILIVGLVLFLMTQLHFYDNLDSHNNELVSRFSPVFKKAMNDFNQFVRKNGNIISFLSLPVYAFYSWLIVKKQQLNYAEQLTVIVFAMAFVYTYNALLLLALIVFNITGLGAASIPLALILVSLCLTYKQYFSYKWSTAILKGLLVFACGCVTQVIILMFGLIIYFLIIRSRG